LLFYFFPGLIFSQESKPVTDRSKEVHSDFRSPEIFVQPDSFYLVIRPDTIKQMEMTIFNTGDDTLVYSIEANSGLWTSNPEPPDNIEGSELTISPTGYKPGETIDFNMNLYNGSPDNEWIDTLIVYFPEGATVNFATNFIGGTQGPLVFDGSTGNGSSVSWYDADGSNGGNILPGETAISIANIHFDESLNDTLSIVYTIKGDGFGGTPHSITDTIKLTPEEVWLIADPESGVIPPGEEIQTDLFFNSAGIPIGYYDRHFTIHSNDTSNPDFDVPVKLIVFPSSLTHTITIPEGLSAISTYVIPLNSEFETIFDTVNDKIDVVHDIESNLYWPDQGINTIGTWNNGQGYVVNAKEDLQIKVYGLFVISQTVVLNQGWNLMPVLNINPSSTFVVFRDIEELIDIVEEVGGDKVYWPEQSIYTLTQLMPGKAYFIRVKEDCSIVFPPPVKSGE
jgi:hypothetical protein